MTSLFTLLFQIRHSENTFGWKYIYLLLYSHKLTLLTALLISDGGYHRLEGTVDSLRLCIESQVSDIVRNDNGIGDTTAKLLHP